MSNQQGREASASKIATGDHIASLYSRGFDPDSPLFVAVSLTVSTLVGAAAGGGFSFSRGINPFEGAGILGGRYLIISSGFFGLREYLISPLLVTSLSTCSSAYARRLGQLSTKQLGKLPSPTPLDAIRSERLLDSGIAGALTAGIYTAFSRGRSFVIKASLTGALIATILQFTANTGRHARLSYLLRFAPTPDEPKYAQTTVQHLRASFENPTMKTEATGNTLSERIMDAMSYVAPITKLTQEEYLEKLNEERKDIDKRLNQIEREEDELYELSQRLERERARSR